MRNLKTPFDNGNENQDSFVDVSITNIIYFCTFTGRKGNLFE